MAEWSNSELALAVAAGVWSFKEFLVPLVRGSFNRNLQAEDEHKKKVEERLTELDTMDREQGKDIARLNGLDSQLGEIKGRLTALDTRIAEQGKAHDIKLGEALALQSTDFNRKLTAALNAELEGTVREMLREELAVTRKVKR